MSKKEQYIARLLRENPTHTASGTPIEICNNGENIRTHTGKAWNHTGYSVYNPWDYPRLFGWDKEPSMQEKLDLIMEHLGLEFEYVPSQLKIVKRKKS